MALRQGNNYLDFPFDVGENGTIRVTDRDEHIKDEIISVLLTSPGERVNNPEFGCNLRDLIFAPNNDLVATMIHLTIIQALTRWLDDRIIIDSVDIENQEESVFVDIKYTIKETMERGSVELSIK